jgi:hypothetical protein
MKRFRRVHDSLWQFSQDGILVQVEELGLSEGADRELWHVRIDLESVDAANNLREAKRIARQCLWNVLERN